MTACGAVANPFSIQKAYADTVSARTARVSFTVAVNQAGSNAGSPMSFGGTGVMNLDGRAMDLNAQLPGGLGTIRIEMLGTTLYMDASGIKRFAGGQGGLPAGKSWIKMDLARLLGPGAMSAAGSATANDPGDLLAQLKAASASGLRNLGTADVDGAQTTHYRMTVDIAKAAAKMAAAPDATPLTKATAAREAHMAPAPVDLWVDAHNLIHPFRMTMHPSSTTTMTETMTLSDFGVPVSIQPPPAAATVDATSLPGFNQGLQSQSAAGAGSATSG